MNEELWKLWKVYVRHQYPDDRDRQLMLEGLFYQFLNTYGETISDMMAINDFNE